MLASAEHIIDFGPEFVKVSAGVIPHSISAPSNRIGLIGKPQLRRTLTWATCSACFTTTPFARGIEERFAMAPILCSNTFVLCSERMAAGIDIVQSFNEA